MLPPGITEQMATPRCGPWALKSDHHGDLQLRSLGVQWGEEALLETQSLGAHPGWLQLSDLG